MAIQKLCAAMLAGASIMLPASAAACEDPFVGVWQLDLEKSEFSHGAGVTSKTLIFSEVEAGMLITETVVTDEGETVVYRIPYTYGGGFVPQTANPNYDALAVDLVDPRTAASTLQLRGKIVGKARQHIAEDGKSMEFTSELSLPSGGTAWQKSVFRRF